MDGNISPEPDPTVVIKKKEEQTKLLNYFQLFRFATPWDIFLIFLSVILSIARAAMLPAGIVIYSEFVAILVDRIMVRGTSTKTVFLELLGGGKVLTNPTEEDSYAEIRNDSISYGILLAIVSILMFVTGALSIDIFNYSALRQVTRIRNAFFRSILTQDIGWHDVITDQNFATRVTDDIEKIRDGIGEKACHFLTLILGFLISGVISFVYGWKLTLAVSVYIPIVILTTIFVTKYQGKLTMRESNAYAKAGNILEEILTNIKTVVAFHGEEKEAERYDRYLEPAKKAGQRRGIFTGFGDGVLRSLLFISCSGAFWYGVNLILEDRYKEDKEYTPAILMIAFFGILVGADNISRTSPFLEAFAAARGAATNIFSIIDRESKIDPLSTEGKIVNYGLKGDIEFQDIFFKYPSREEITVLRGLNIKIASGQTVALVGYSGCGKSTCIQLIQRFYDPIFGQVLLDNYNIKKYNTSWLRSNIGVVGQEPVLFATTIGENIRYGKPKATQKEIEDAARLSGIHDFITSLPECYNTMVGEKGTQLSGGQKQRIAIARAVVGNPKILLLDEATSALDYESERLVQQALDLARKGRTTIVVSHRLSAIKSADKIVYIEAGKVCEEGTHEELMMLGGKYHKMVSAGGLSSLDAETENEKNIKTEFIEKNFQFELNNLHERHKSIDEGQFEFDPFLPKKEEPRKEVPRGTFSNTFKRILIMAKPEWCFLILGSIAAALFGCTYPCFAILFGEFYAALSQTEDNRVREDVRVLCIAFLVVGIGTGIVCFIQTYLFNISGVFLTLRIRSRVVRSIMTQEIAWFNEEKNSVGSLSAQMAGDVADFQGSIGYPLSGLIQSVGNFALGCSLAFYYSWKLALLCLAIVPIVAGIVVYEARMMTKSTIEEKAIQEEATRIATEAITNIRTVAGLRQEAYIISRYNVETQKVEAQINKKIRLRGTVNSFGQASLFCGYAVALCYGGILVSQKAVQFQNIIKVSETLLYGSFMLGQSLAFTPAFTAALFAGQRLFTLLDRKPHIQSPIPPENDDKYEHNFNSRFSNVQFRYPNRPDIPVLQGLNLEIMQGKTIGLVGHSGCGKSTCIQLLQRFFDPDEGKITIGSKDISRDISLKGLRSKLGIVSQEPVLFEKTIAENIAYGDNSREVSLAEIMEAAKMANIHSFIVTLPNGYETNLGSKGTQLSGGEKQRIAIARALIRNPKILLLDEATSALDLQSEKIVQAALDLACTGRTCLVIAHRLSTIQNADVICVIDKGQVVEQGTHQSLLSQKGLYYSLYKTQPSLD